MSSRLIIIRPRKPRVWGQNRLNDGAQRNLGGVLDEAVVLVVRSASARAGSGPGPGRRCDRSHRSPARLACGNPAALTWAAGFPACAQWGSRSAALGWPAACWQCFGSRFLQWSWCLLALLVLVACLLRGFLWAWSASCRRACGRCDILRALRVVPATPALASHVMYFARGAGFVSRFLRLHSGRAVDHSLGAVKNPERDHLPGRTGQDAGMWAVSTAGFIRSPPRCNATFRND